MVEVVAALLDAPCSFFAEGEGHLIVNDLLYLGKSEFFFRIECILHIVYFFSENEEKNIANCISNSISISTFISMALISDFPVANFVRTNFSHFILNDDNVPDLGFVLFKTGKNMNSKTKFENVKLAY